MRKPSETPYCPQPHELQLLRAFEREAQRRMPQWEPPCIIERPAEKCEHGVWLGAPNNHVYCGFPAYSFEPFDPAEYNRWIEIVKEHQRIKERQDHHCGTCNETIPVHLRYCESCAPNALINPPTPAVEIFNTIGSAAQFYESKARTLSARNAITFETVQLFSRTILCDVLSEVAGRQVNALAEAVGVDDPHDKLFRVFGEDCPFAMRLLKRFYLWTHGIPIEEIAAVEDTTRQAVERFIYRWIEIIESVVSPLGSLLTQTNKPQP